jgi:CBS domain-containing protein
MNIDLLYRAGTITAREGDTLLMAGRRMARNNISALPVLRQGVISGILTERDLARALLDRADPATALVRNYMTPSPATVEWNADSREVARQMMSLGVRHLPVMRGGELVGVISARDLLLLEAWSPLTPADSVPEWAMP